MFLFFSIAAAYWDDYDINVPLNLGPAYAWRALDDLRLIAARQNVNKPFAGSFLFESGWEFGFSLGALAHYEACWDPHLSENDTTSATAAVLVETGFDDHFGAGSARTFALVGEKSRLPLVFGDTTGTTQDTARLNGICYLQVLFF